MIMSDPRFSCSEEEQESMVHEPPCLEFEFLRPRFLNAFSQRKEANLWSKSQLSSDFFYGSSKGRASGEVSCELHLGVGDNPRRVCRICHRQFLSGRALGGHMRVHGPLFQSAGTKRKLNDMINNLESGQDASNRIHMEVSDSKGSDLSSVSRTFSKNQGFRYDGTDESIMTSDSDGEGVADSPTSESYLDGLDRNKHFSVDFDSAADASPMTVASVKRIPVCGLRHNPKESSGSEENELSMGVSLQDASAAHPTLQGSVFSTLETPRICSECGKSFWSLKALFGHMRCHPERDWRGMSAPKGSFRLSKKKLFAKSRLTETSELEPDSDVENKKCGTEIAFHHIKKSTAPVKAEHLQKHDFVDDDGVSKEAECFEETLTRDDDDASRRRWPTGKRSRRKFIEGKAETEAECVQQTCPSLRFEREEPASTSECGSLEEQHEETPDFLLMLAEAARTIERETHDLLKMTWHECKNCWKGCEEESGLAIAMAAKQAHAAAVARSIADGIVKYECSTCKKAFNSPQALGGHRASHRKMKGCFARNSVLRDEVEESHSLISNGLENSKHDAYFSVAAGEKITIQSQRKAHECSVCHRIFSTGQALGGHKRCHYIGERAVEGANLTSINKHMVYDDWHFSRPDLNMPAPFSENGEKAGFPLQLRLFDANVNEKVKQESSDEPQLIRGHRHEWARGAAVA